MIWFDCPDLSEFPCLIMIWLFVINCSPCSTNCQGGTSTTGRISPPFAALRAMAPRSQNVNDLVSAFDQ
jgi:hypothetical protein